MTRSVRHQGGFTMVELMLVCFISLIVFGATLSAWTSLYRSNRAVEHQNDNAENARVALDRAARQLRNLANPSVNAITTIKLATNYDFVFQTSDPNKTWVRYCLDTSGPNGATLWEHENKSDVSGMLSGCPNKDWTRYTAVAEGVTNTLGGLDRNVFTYECSVNRPVTCPASAAEYPMITNVGMKLWVDSNVADRVSELNVGTGVFLRNQNEAPTASVSEPQKLSVVGRWILNGSGSSDPEGRTLEYFWFEDAPPSPTQIASTPCTAEFPGADWLGVTYIKRFTDADVGTHNFYLLVRDPGCLTSLAGPIPIKIT